MRPSIDLSSDVVVGALARCSFPPAGTAVHCAVSGGADSLALLALAVAGGCSATAVHVDHGLRPGSAGEGEAVREVAHRLGAAFRAEAVEVGPGPNLEARARDVRRAVLPADALTGHTADDRAETVLLNLLRGAGPRGAAGIARSPRRPLLDLRRRDTEAVCSALHLEPVEDPTNRDPVHRRNRIRHEVLPLLADIAQRDVVAVLVRQADLFAQLDATIAHAGATVDPSNAADLAAAPPLVAGAAVQAWLLGAGVGTGHPVDGAAVDRVLAVARGQQVATEVTGGWRVARSAGRLRLVPPGAWQDARHG